MSAAADRSGRIRRREEEEQEEENDLQTAEVAQSVSQLSDQSAGAIMAAGSSPADPSALAAQPHPPSLSVQPLPEQIRKRPRRSPRFSSPLDMLAVVELQLVLQFLDTDSRLKAARCCRQLMHAASVPFAWQSALPFVVEARSAAEVERIRTSLLRFAPIHLRCIGLRSLGSVVSVPNLVGLDMLQAPHISAADLSQLLQHPSLARLKLLRQDLQVSRILTADTMRLIARLPHLRFLELAVPDEQATGAGFFRPLADAAALSHLTLYSEAWTAVSATMLDAISQCAKLQRLILSRLVIRGVHFLSFFSSPGMQRLQHIKLTGFLAAGEWHFASDDSRVPNADEYRAVFSQLKQLRSLTLQKVYGIDSLLAHLHRAPALRILSIRCLPDNSAGTSKSRLPSLAVLSALLTAAPHLEVELLMPATLDRWTALRPSAAAQDHAASEQQWRELQRMGAELERVTVVDWQR